MALLSTYMDEGKAIHREPGRPRPILVPFYVNDIEALLSVVFNMGYYRWLDVCIGYRTVQDFLYKYPWQSSI